MKIEKLKSIKHMNFYSIRFEWDIVSNLDIHNNDELASWLVERVTGYEWECQTGENPEDPTDGLDYFNLILRTWKYEYDVQAIMVEFKLRWL